MFKFQSKSTTQDCPPLKVLYKMQNGTITELENRVGLEKVRQFEALGYIENAPSASGYTFRATQRANQIAKGLYGCSLYDWASDLYYRYIN